MWVINLERSIWGKNVFPCHLLRLAYRGQYRSCGRHFHVTLLPTKLVGCRHSPLSNLNDMELSSWIIVLISENIQNTCGFIYSFPNNVKYNLISDKFNFDVLAKSAHTLNLDVWLKIPCKFVVVLYCLGIFTIS